MFKKILLVFNEKNTQEHLEAVKKTKQALKEQDFVLIGLSHLNEEHFKDKDLIITIGGDGTFIKTSHFITKIPILGINSEPGKSEGALTGLTAHEIDYLKEILKGKYQIIKKHRAQVTFNKQPLKEQAINDVYIGSENQFHTSRYIIIFKNKKEFHKSSGVLVSTSAGSTAWYKSAGGKPFLNEEKLKFLIREPYQGKVFNPDILTGEIHPGEKLEIESKREKGGVIALDSAKIIPFNTGDKVEIKLSDMPLNVLFPLKENPN